MTSFLSDDQRVLLVSLVEAERAVAATARRPFMAFGTASSYNLRVVHPGLSGRHGEAYPADLETLGEAGLIRLSSDGGRGYTFDVTQAGRQAYATIIGATNQPAAVVEESVNRYVDSDDFRRSHPEAYDKWSEAARLLWSAAADRELTKIGHLCREAAQAFAESLLRLAGVTTRTDRTQTKARVQAVLEALDTGSAELGVLKSLHGYWAALLDLGQRQEHGAAKEGTPLTWEDGRAVVFGTLVAMYELHRVVARRSK